MFLMILYGITFAQNVEYVSSTLWSGIIDVEVAGDYAYCEIENGLIILDITNPGSPTLTSQYYQCGHTPIMFGTPSGGIDVEGDYTYMAFRDSGLVIIDISDIAYR